MAMDNTFEESTVHGIWNPRTGRRRACRASQVVSLRKPYTANSGTANNKTSLKICKRIIKICTWNIRTMYQAGKINNAIQGMTRLGIHIMGISKMRWPDAGHCTQSENVKFIILSDKNQHIHGVGIVIS